MAAPLKRQRFKLGGANHKTRQRHALAGSDLRQSKEGGGGASSPVYLWLVPPSRVKIRVLTFVETSGVAITLSTDSETEGS